MDVRSNMEQGQSREWRRDEGPDEGIEETKGTRRAAVTMGPCGGGGAAIDLNVHNNCLLGHVRSVAYFLCCAMPLAMRTRRFVKSGSSGFDVESCLAESNLPSLVLLTYGEHATGTPPFRLHFDLQPNTSGKNDSRTQ